MKAKTYTPVTYGRFLQLFYPIGSYFKTVNDTTDPNVLFPYTTWKKLSFNNAFIISGNSGEHHGGNTCVITQNNIRRLDQDTDSNQSSHNHNYWPLVTSKEDRGDYASDGLQYSDSSYPDTFGDNQGFHSHSMTVGVSSPTKIDLSKSFKRLYCIIWERVS